jgi:hypothetical protein
MPKHKRAAGINNFLNIHRMEKVNKEGLQAKNLRNSARYVALLRFFL